MEARAIETKKPTIAVDKVDLVRAWTLMEQLVVSLRKMGSYYSVPSGETDLSPAAQAEMQKDLDEYFSPEMVRELSKVRVVLGQYLDDEEAEAISEQLEFWKKKST